MDQRHIINRIDKFLTKNAFCYYADRILLKSQCTSDDDPIHFKELEGRKWKEVMIGEEWGSDWRSAWFKFNGRIPLDWKDRTVVAVIDTGSEACCFDSKGMPVCGLTSKAEAVDPMYRKAMIPVAERARGGEEVELLVEAAANNIMGHQERAILKDSTLALFRRDIWSLYHDLFFLYDLAVHLPESSVRRVQILAELNRALNLYRDGGEQDVARSREELLPALQKTANASAPEVSAVGHAHIDLAWLWPLRETVRKAGRSFSSALCYMNEYPEYIFGASQPQLYQFVKDRYPHLYRKIKKAVAEGRWELQGGMWVEPDCNLSGGESLVRQILYGKRFFKEEFGIDVNNLWLPDVFGFSPVLPQLMVKSGLKYLMSQKLSWNKTNVFPYHTFLWEGLDGSQVLVHFLPADTYNSTMQPQDLLRAEANFKEKDIARSWLYLFGEGDGGGGPGRHHLELARRARNAEGLPRVTMETARDFFRKAEQDIVKVPEWRGELYLEAHRGTLTTRGKTKWYNRRAEYLLHDLEFLLLINQVLLGSDYPQDRQEQLWKLLLLNQFHDILPGTNIEWVFRDSCDQFARLFREGEKLIRDSLANLVSGLSLETGKKRGFLLINTTGFIRNQVHYLPLKHWNNCDAVQSSDGALLPVQQSKKGFFIECKLRPYSLNSFTAVPKGSISIPPNMLKVDEKLLENEQICVEFSEEGTICRIFDKLEKREVVAENTRANVLHIYRDTPVDYDAWDIDPHYSETPPVESDLISTEIHEKGPLCISLVQKRLLGRSEITQEILLYRNSKIIEFRTQIDWRENQKMLKVAFPLRIYTDSADFEVQFGNIKRSNYRNTSWEAAKFEVFAHKWADLSECGYGVALLNDCKYGYNVHRNTLELTLLRSPMDPDPHADREIHRFNYALLPHNGDFREGQVIPAGYFLNIPLICFDLPRGETKTSSNRKLETNSFFSVDRKNVVIETIKRAERDKAIIVRLYEAWGMRTEVTLKSSLPVRNVEEVDLLEEKIQVLPVIKDGRGSLISFHIKPYEIKTVNLIPEKEGR